MNKELKELIKAYDIVDDLKDNGDDENADKLKRIIVRMEDFIIEKPTKRKSRKTKLLTAKKLLDFLVMQEKSGVNLKKVLVNFRENNDSDVVVVRAVEEDLFDSETNRTLTSIMLLNDDTDR